MEKLPQNAETNSQVCLRLLQDELSSRHKWEITRRLPSLRGGSIVQERKAFSFGPYDGTGTTIYESRTARYWRGQPVEIRGHTLTLVCQEGMDAEGKSSALTTRYYIDVVRDEIEVSQSSSYPTYEDQVNSTSNVGIKDAPVEQQWQQLRDLLERRLSEGQ